MSLFQGLVIRLRLLWLTPHRKPSRAREQAAMDSSRHQFRKMLEEALTDPATAELLGKSLGGQALSSDRFRELLIETLDDPATARWLGRRLLLPVFPIQGGVCTAAADVGPGIFGTNCAAGDYTFSNSKVGIGVSSPTGRLEIDDSNGLNIRLTRLSFSAARFDISTDGTNMFVGPTDSGDLILRSGAAVERMRILGSNGKVGIGTATPVGRLEIDDPSGLNIRITRLSFSTARFDISTDGTDLFIGPADSGDLVLRSGASVNRVRILGTNGNVGIGTASPLVRLDARGSNAKATTAAFENILEVASTDATSPLALRGGIKTDATAGNRYGAIEVDDAGTKRPLALQASGGNVGIGTTNPIPKLHVKSAGEGIWIEDVGGAGRLGFLQTGETSARNVIYRDTNDFTVVRNFNTGVYTICKIWAPTGAVTGDREATLALVRGDNDEEFMDVYNNGYTTETQYGIRIQKRLTGVYRDFVFDQAGGPNVTDRKFIMVVRPTRKVGVGTRATPAKLSIKGESFTATGTVSVPSNTATVNGTGTLFLQEVDPGDKVTVSGQTRTVMSIASETSLTVDTAFSGAPSGSMTVLQNLLRVDDSSGNAKIFVSDQGNVGIGNSSPNFVLHTSGAPVALGAPSSAPTDANLNNSNISFWLDEAANNLKIRVKYSNGTLKTATIVLA